MTSQEINQQLMTLSPEYRVRFNEERSAFFNDTPFTYDLPDNFDHYRFFCGGLVNECMLEITANTYITLFFSKSIGEYNIGNMVSILIASEKATFLSYVQAFGKKEGCNPAEEWAYMRTSFEKITHQINDLIEPAMEKILKKLQALQHNLIKANGHTGDYKKGKNISLP